MYELSVEKIIAALSGEQTRSLPMDARRYCHEAARRLKWQYLELQALMQFLPEKKIKEAAALVEKWIEDEGDGEEGVET